MIWEYNKDKKCSIPFEIELRKMHFYDGHSVLQGPFSCPFCSSPMINHGHDSFENFGDEYYGVNFYESANSIVVCNTCGLWAMLRMQGECNMPQEDQVYNYANETWQTDWVGYPHVSMKVYGVFSSLKSFNNKFDLSAPTEELMRYLTGKYDHRFRVHPKKMEEIVGSIFKNGGYETRATSYSKDGGVDLFVFDHGTEELAAVQVKRYKNKIDCNLIDQFGGVLVRHGVTKGIYVTTSSFTSVAQQYAQEFDVKDIPIELWDSTVLLDRIRTSLRPVYEDIYEDGTSPFFELLEDIELRYEFEDEIARIEDEPDWDFEPSQE